MLLGGDILALMAFIALAPVSLGELAATPEMLFTAAAPLVAGARTPARSMPLQRVSHAWYCGPLRGLCAARKRVKERRS